MTNQRLRRPQVRRRTAIRDPRRGPSFFIYLLAVAILLLNSTASMAEHDAQYTLHIDGELSRADVTACFESRPSALIALAPEAKRRLRWVRVRSAEARRRLQSEDQRIELDGLPRQLCLDYRVDLTPEWGTCLRGELHRYGTDLVVSPQLVLWYPDDEVLAARMQIELDLPGGVAASTPWEPLATDGPHQRFRPAPRLRDWDARIAFGRFRPQHMEIGGARLEIAILDGQPKASVADVMAWLEQGARALTTLYGRFPVPAAQVLVVPVGKAGEPVPWGEVARGGGDSVHLYIDQTRPLAEFVDDWTLTHELSHLVHPPIDHDEVWLSEGLASYYQNVLRARAGQITAEEAWQNLNAGFERGIRGTRPGRSLAQVTETMMRDRAFMRVYWSGAAIVLIADAELRARSGGSRSLDTTLAAYQACCLPATRHWSGRELMQRFDELSKSTVFTTLYDEYANADRFPDLTGTYRALGLQSRGDALAFDESARDCRPNAR